MARDEAENISTGKPRAIKVKLALSFQWRKLVNQISVFWTVKLAQLLCVVYIMVLTFSPAPIGLVDPGTIHDPLNRTNTENSVILFNGHLRAVVAETPFHMACRHVTISRMSAFSLYPPVMILVFLTKCRACANFLSSTPISMFMVRDTHELHAFCVHYIAFDVWIHTLFHLLRWGSHGNISWLWTHPTGISGLAVVACTPIICLLMMYGKETFPYEVRKGFHYLFYIFAIGLCWHAPVSGIPNGGFIAPVLGFCICLSMHRMHYKDYIILFTTERIETRVGLQSGLVNCRLQAAVLLQSAFTAVDCMQAASSQTAVRLHAVWAACRLQSGGSAYTRYPVPGTRYLVLRRYVGTGTGTGTGIGIKSES